MPQDETAFAGLGIATLDTAKGDWFDWVLPAHEANPFKPMFGADLPGEAVVVISDNSVLRLNRDRQLDLGYDGISCTHSMDPSRPGLRASHLLQYLGPASPRRGRTLSSSITSCSTSTRRDHMTGYTDAPLPAASLRLDSGVSDADAVITGLLDWAVDRRPRQIGYPVATDIDFSPLSGLFNVFLNNIGDPSRPCAFNNTQQVERAVIAWFADLFALPATDRWGYIATGGTESNLNGVHTGRRRFPDAVVYHSETAHYSVGKVSEVVAGQNSTIVVRADDRGEMDYEHFDQLVAQNRARPAIVIATAGTTMTEARDDVRASTPSSTVTAYPDGTSTSTPPFRASRSRSTAPCDSASATASTASRFPATNGSAPLSRAACCSCTTACASPATTSRTSTPSTPPSPDHAPARPPS